VKRRKRGLLWIAVIIFPLSLVTSVYSSDELGLKPRVPADKLAEVKGLPNLVPANPETLEEGREIFMGKGICRPRNFTAADWQKARTDGEIFWAITKGTEYGMIAFEDMLSVEERWMLVNYIRKLGK